MTDIYTTKRDAEELLESWYHSDAEMNLRIRKEKKNLYIITHEP